MDESIQERLIPLVAFQLGVYETGIPSHAHFVDDLGADSLDVIELVMALEEEFDITIPDEDIEKFETVDHAIDYIGDRLRGLRTEKLDRVIV